MKIKKIDIYGLRLPLKEPFIVAYDRYEDMPTILIKVETDSGIIGWGEAVPDQHVTGETWHSTLQVLKHELAPLLLNENPFDIDRIHRMMNHKIYGCPSAKAAIDCALYDLMGKISKQPVYRLIGGKAHDQLYVPQVISIKTPIEMAADAKRIVESGFTNLKLKVGTDPETDIERIRAVRNALPNQNIKLRVDANQGWDRIGALKVIEATRDCDIEWFEQPVKATDLHSLMEIRHVSHAKIMIDEGIHSIHELIRVIQMRAADLINIKLMKTGGIYPALAIASLAEAENLPCQVGSMVESAIGTLAGAHLAIARSIIQTNELVGPLMFTHDVAETTYHHDVLVLNDQPGLGIEVNEAFVKNLATIHFTV